MTETKQPPIAFNLWTDPWIDLERPDGTVERQGIAAALLGAQEFLGIFSTSPLEVVGIHRLLTAVLQDALHPQTLRDLQPLWQAGCFPAEAIQAFGAEFAQRFDLFSAQQPFLQSSDLPLTPQKGAPVKPVTYLAPEFPCATAVNHYHHLLDDQQAFCPVCCARGLLVLPAFASSGGAGIKPSINGVPPVYVLPDGRTLFDSLAASLALPPYQPAVRDSQTDRPWWRREALVGKSVEALSVGYLESLTYPARRVRLYPTAAQTTCTRCGAVTPLVVRSMTFEMGLSRPKDAPFWRDPFAAYFLREKESPLPLRPVAGKALWREYASLFLSLPAEPLGKKRAPLRPALVDQLAWMEESGVGPKDGWLAFRCVGIRTDMKAKIFEWTDTGVDVPLALLQSGDAGLDVEECLRFAVECEGTLADVAKKYLNENRKKGERFAHARAAMMDAYWGALAEPFRGWIADLADAYTLPRGERQTRSAELRLAWFRKSVETAHKALETTLDQVGTDGRSLRLRFQCLEEASQYLYGKLKKKKEALQP